MPAADESHNNDIKYINVARVDVYRPEVCGHVKCRSAISRQSATHELEEEWHKKHNIKPRVQDK